MNKATATVDAARTRDDSWGNVDSVKGTPGDKGRWEPSSEVTGCVRGRARRTRWWARRTRGPARGTAWFQRRGLRARLEDEGQERLFRIVDIVKWTMDGLAWLDRLRRRNEN